MPRGDNAVLNFLRLALIALYTAFWGPIAAVGALFSGEAIVWCARRWMRWIFATCGLRVVAEGVERAAAAQPAIFMANHQSLLDAGALVLTLPFSWRFIAKKELLFIPFFGWALAASDQIVIDRGNRLRAIGSLRRAAQRVRGGANVVLFPEGTRSHDGALGELKSGGFHLAIEAQAPIVPVSVSGSFELAPRHALRVRPGVLKIVYGEPIPSAGLGPGDRHALKAKVRAAIEAGFDRDFPLPPR